MQNFQNHTRWYPLVHFVVVPIFLINLIWQIVRFSQEKTWDRAESVLIAVGFLLLNMAARFQALKAQNRLIRLEEKLRYKEILPTDLFAESEKLKTGQIIALRFASDEELPDLMRKTLSGEFKTTKEIKQAIKNWRGDYHRV